MDRLCWKALALQSFRVRRVNYLSVKHSLQHLELHGTHWAASSLRGSWSFVANPESFWYETFSLCSLLIQALPLTRCSADAFSLLIPGIVTLDFCCVCAICSTMGPWYSCEASGWECDTNNDAPEQPGHFHSAVFQIVSFLHTHLAILKCELKLLFLTFAP